MADELKKERAKKDDSPLKVNGSFMDIINASVKQSKANTAAKKKKQ